jgi:hypothetical protein
MTTFKALTLGFLALGLACATPRSQLRRDQTGRLTDGPAEKLAAMPVPDPAADPENKDQRFGIESARERGETAKRKREEKNRCVDVISKREAAREKPPCLPATK